MNIAEEIRRLCREKNAIIMAHYYQRPEIQDIADFVGDSLALAQVAAKTDADIIVMCGVHFMAETAKILCPDKKVLIPAPEAGCSLADSCKAADLAAWKVAHPNHMVVSYVNTSAAVKALTDVVVTSSNALKIVKQLPEDRPILFGPDQNLGGYINRMTGRSMELWNGGCHVHARFSEEALLALKEQYPTAKVLAHPECKQSILQHADVIGSTQALLDYAKQSMADTKNSLPFREGMGVGSLLAIGEIGLDYHWDTTFKEQQHEALREQMRWAEQYHLPVMIHSRDATEDTLKILREFPTVKGVMHCFSGSHEVAQQVVEMGYYLGIGGVLTFKNCKLAEHLVGIPLERLVLETDAPYMAPVPHRGKRNESRWMWYVVERLAQVYNCTPEHVNEVTTANAKALFVINL